MRQLVQTLAIPLLTIFVLVLTLLSGLATDDFQASVTTTMGIYLIYVTVPIILAEFIVLRRASTKHPFAFLVGLIIIFWTWWFIEFSWLPSVSSFIPLDEFIAILTIGWSFLIIMGHKIPRTVTRYLRKETFKIYGAWVLILLVTIAPAALYSGFISFGLNEILTQGFMALPLALGIFLGIFFFTAVVEEVLFRGLIYQWTVNHLDNIKMDRRQKTVLLMALFGFASLLIFFTPLLGLANPIVTGPFKDIPLPVVYSSLAMMYFVVGLLLVTNTDNTEFLILVWSSMVFGWAHFEDWRYLMFATIAGIGYCDTYRRTKNVLASATLHATVNFIWAMVLAG